MTLPGIPEMLLILLIVAIIFGGRKLPELGKGLGEAIKNFKNSLSKDKKEKKEDDEKLDSPDEKNN